MDTDKAYTEAFFKTAESYGVDPVALAGLLHMEKNAQLSKFIGGIFKELAAGGKAYRTVATAAKGSAEATRAATEAAQHMSKAWRAAKATGRLPWSKAKAFGKGLRDGRDWAWNRLGRIGKWTGAGLALGGTGYYLGRRSSGAGAAGEDAAGDAGQAAMNPVYMDQPYVDAMSQDIYNARKRLPFYYRDFIPEYRYSDRLAY